MLLLLLRLCVGRDHYARVSTYDLRDSSHSVRDYKINCIRRRRQVKRAHNHARQCLSETSTAAAWLE